MNILFVGKRFYTNRDALQEKYGRIYHLPRQWADAGINTKLWLVDYHTRTALERCDGTLEIKSTPAFSPALPLNWLKISTRRSYPSLDTVIASGDCYIGWMAYLLARRLRARFIFDVYDKYDEFSGYRSPPGIDLFTYLLDKADIRLFASNALMGSLRRSPKDCLVPNGIDDNLFAPRDMQASRESLGIPPDKILVGYFGSITEDRGVADLIKAMKILRNSGRKIELILAGKKEIELDTSPDGINYLGNLAPEKIPRAMACCDVLALPYRNSAYLDMASSCKIAEYIAMQRPIVATLTPNIASNFPQQAKQLQYTLAIPGNPESIARSINQQLASRILASPPDNTTWREIATATLGRIMQA